MAFYSTKSINDTERSHSFQLERGDNHSGLLTRTKRGAGDDDMKEYDQNGSETTPKPFKSMKMIDETLLPPDEAEMLLMKRAYNRDSASRARNRRKEVLQDMNRKVRELQEDKNELRRSLKQMEKINETLLAQNKELLVEVSQLRGRTTTSNNFNSKGSARLPSIISNSRIDLAQQLFHQQRAAEAAFAFASMNHPSASSSSASLEYFKYLHNV